MLAMNGNQGAVLSNVGGVNWRSITQFTKSVWAYCIDAEGSWHMFGADGFYAVYAPGSVDAPLTPLAGYLPTFNASVTNPDTGLPWTPAEAAASRFGMRITS